MMSKTRKMEKKIKPLTYNGEYHRGEWALPRVRIEDISPERRRSLRRKRLRNMAEDEFEEWLAVMIEDNKWIYSCEEGDDLLHPGKKELASEETLSALAAYHRAEYNHIRQSARWEE